MDIKEEITERVKDKIVEETKKKAKKEARKRARKARRLFVGVHWRVIAALIKGEDLPEPPEWHFWCR